MKTRLFPGLWLFITLLLTLPGCSIEAQPINFGQDQCHACRMTIVDKKFAAQAVTKKGKQQKYDSSECMVRNLVAQGNEAEMSLILTADHDDATMIDATKAVYLISPRLPSPMGANLSAYRSKPAAQAAQQTHGGELHSWQNLKSTLVPR